MTGPNEERVDRQHACCGPLSNWPGEPQFFRTEVCCSCGKPTKQENIPHVGWKCHECRTVQRYQKRQAFCDGCGDTTSQTWFPTRRHWICENRNEGCGQVVWTYDELQRQAQANRGMVPLTARDLYGDY